MERRTKLRVTRRAALAGIAAVLTNSGHAQQPARRLGVMMGGTETPDSQPYLTAFTDGLRALGWVEGSNLSIDTRWAPNNYAAFAGDLVSAAPDVLMADSTVCLRAMQRATSTIPIVFVRVSDPVAQGFVSSIAHPGGNVTGFTSFEFSMGGKALDILKQMVPALAQVAVLANPDTAPQYPLFLRSIEDAAPKLSVQARGAPVHDDAEIEHAIAALSREGNGGLMVLSTQFTGGHRAQIFGLTTRYRVPAIYFDRAETIRGGLVSYGVDQFEEFRQAAGYVDRILKGEKPGDLPIQRPTKFQLVINLKTATALDLTVPPLLLTGADEVIE